MNTLPSYLWIPVLTRKASQCTRIKRLKCFSGQKGYRVSQKHEKWSTIQPCNPGDGLIPFLLHQMPGETLGKSCRDLFSSPTWWQAQEPVTSSARAMLTKKVKIVQCSEAVVWRTPRKASTHIRKGDFCSICLGCSNLGSLWEQVGQGFGQPDLVKDVPADVR